MKLGKRRKLLEAHPFCCFCGGATPSLTIDHVPNRACFPQRQFPDGFEFPACQLCQDASRKDEQVFSFMVHLSDQNPANRDRDMAKNAISGMVNNHPMLVPEVLSGANDKRRALRQLGQQRPEGLYLDRVPAVSFNPEINRPILRYASKIGLALYYREMFKVALQNYLIWSAWTQATNLKQMESFVEVSGFLPKMTIGSRTNINFGDRFRYRWSASDPEEDVEVFATTCQFGDGMVIAVLIAEDLPIEEQRSGWVSVSDLMSTDSVPGLIENPLMRDY